MMSYKMFMKDIIKTLSHWEPAIGRTAGNPSSEWNWEDLVASIFGCFYRYKSEIDMLHNKRVFVSEI